MLHVSEFTTTLAETSNNFYSSNTQSQFWWARLILLLRTFD